MGQGGRPYRRDGRRKEMGTGADGTGRQMGMLGRWAPDGQVGVVEVLVD